jgi:glycosyltransferase involved in cell wall biosynthesis
VPVVAPNSFGLPDLVKHGTTGLLVEPGHTDLLADAVLGLLRDPAEIRRLGSAAVDDVRSRLSVTVRNRKLLAAYEEALRGPAA